MKKRYRDIHGKTRTQAIAEFMWKHRGKILLAIQLLGNKKARRTANKIDRLL